MRDRLYATYRENHERARKVVVPEHGLSEDGGSAVGYYDDRGLFLAQLEIYTETGYWEYAFAVRQGVPELVVERWHKYNRPYYWAAEASKKNGDNEHFDPAKTVMNERAVHFDGRDVICIERTSEEDPFDAPTYLLDLFWHTTELLSTLGAEVGPGVNESLDFPPFIEPNGPSAADTSLCGIGLNDAASAVAVLGQADDCDLVESDRYPMPHASYGASDGSAYATFFLHYGNGMDQYAEMLLSRAAPDTVFGTLPAERFKSGLGIALGMTEEQATTLLGPPAFVGAGGNGHRLLRYEVADPGTMRLTGPPPYYMTLEFGADGLVEYGFGFEYP